MLTYIITYWLLAIILGTSTAIFSAESKVKRGVLVTSAVAALAHSGILLEELVTRGAMLIA